MQLQQKVWQPAAGWSDVRAVGWQEDRRADLVFAFGCAETADPETWLGRLHEHYPGAQVCLASSGGGILDSRVYDECLVTTAVAFDSAGVKVSAVRRDSATEDRAVGRRLAEPLLDPSLRHVFLLLDGLVGNASELVAGVEERLPAGTTVSGGIAGARRDLDRRFVTSGEAFAAGASLAIGFYGASLRVGCGSHGGWDAFGPERRITRSEGTLLHELDGRPALALYRRYLGPKAAELPASALRFPLSLRSPGSERAVVRTVLGIDSAEQTMTFAGEMPEGSYARLMKTSYRGLVGGAARAAATSVDGMEGGADLSLLVSCVGRKQVLGQRVEEETEGVRKVLGDRPILAGFYSLGEIAPFSVRSRAALHNQTMTVTSLAER